MRTTAIRTAGTTPSSALPVADAAATGENNLAGTDFHHQRIGGRPAIPAAATVIADPQAPVLEKTGRTDEESALRLDSSGRWAETPAGRAHRRADPWSGRPGCGPD